MSLAALLTQQHKRECGDGRPVGGWRRFVPADGWGFMVLAASNAGGKEKNIEKGVVGAEVFAAPYASCRDTSWESVGS